MTRIKSAAIRVVIRGNLCRGGKVAGIVCVGAHWGDEGKGKITHLLAPEMDMVVRYQGGNNAGHTVVDNGQALKLHLVPSGILYPYVVPVIANGVVIDPEVLISEIEGLKARGINPDKLLVSGNAHLVMPYHRILDQKRELKLGKSKIGTTRKGIGPTYADKAARVGIRVQDLLDMKIFQAKLAEALKEKNALFTHWYHLEALDSKKIITEFSSYAQRLKKYIADTSFIINQALEKKKKVFFEGAQGTLLDLDHGTYPYVTSSSPVAGGVCVGAGVSPLRISKIIGVVKAYVTRVGSGPFPTEEKEKIGEILREVGNEYGTTTGRARRCGWFDMVLLRYAILVNGLTSIALTKLDVLSQFKRLKICLGYDYENKFYEYFPAHQSIFHKCTPVYEQVEGWQEDISGVRKFKELPPQAQQYVLRIEELGSVPIKIISVGPKKEHTIIRDEPY